MQLSARNQLKGTVKEIKPGVVTAEVVVEVAPGTEIVAVITISSVERLGLQVGGPATVVIKSTDVMLASE